MTRLALLLLVVALPATAKLSLIKLSWVSPNVYKTPQGEIYKTYNCFEKVRNEVVVNISDESILFESSRIICDIRPRSK